MFVISLPLNKHEARNLLGPVHFRLIWNKNIALTFTIPYDSQYYLCLHQCALENKTQIHYVLWPCISGATKMLHYHRENWACDLICIISFQAIMYSQKNKWLPEEHALKHFFFISLIILLFCFLLKTKGQWYQQTETCSLYHGNK